MSDLVDCLKCGFLGRGKPFGPRGQVQRALCSGCDGSGRVTRQKAAAAMLTEPEALAECSRCQGVGSDPTGSACMRCLGTGAMAPHWRP